MRFRKYGMVVEKKPKEWITLRTARRMFIVTYSLAISTAVIGQGLLEYTRYRDSIERAESFNKRMERMGYKDDKAKKEY